MKRSNKSLAINILAIAVGMFGIAYASAPLYNLFCRVTGYGGTTQVAEKLPATPLDKKIKIRFDANTDPSLPWRFKPEQKEITVKIGESGLAFYSAENISDKEITGMATYNVTPNKAAPYFNKIECFCFNRQTIKPRQRVDFPVSFFIDPEIINDKNLTDTGTITLSYTFFAVEKGNK